MSRKPLKRRISTGNVWDDFIADQGGPDGAWAAIVIQLDPRAVPLFSDLAFLRRLKSQFGPHDDHRQSVTDRIRLLERHQ